MNPLFSPRALRRVLAVVSSILLGLACGAAFEPSTQAKLKKFHQDVQQPTPTPAPTPVPMSTLVPAHSHNGPVDEDHIKHDAEMAAKAKAFGAFVLPPVLKVAQTPQELALYGQWSAVRTWPFAFASAASLPDGRILAWGGNNPLSFTGGTSTYAAIWNPANNTITSINHNDHSMFCGIPTMLEDGRVFVNGGDGTRERVSVFDWRTNTWSRVQNMNRERWYPGSVALPNGKVFTALGEPGDVYPEIWTPSTGWALLNGANLQAPILNFPGYQNNWLPYFHLAPNGNIFHSGPTQQMNWINPTGSGSVSSAGLFNSWYPKYSAQVMYDVGKVLVTGGQATNDEMPATNQAYVLDLNGATATRTPIAAMAHDRKFHNAVMLPTGEVLVIGGNTFGEEFSDQGTILEPEIWNPATGQWRGVADISVPRNYHSVALLMTDGRVWSGGGGLCNCAGDHPDHQVFTPPYLYNATGALATRPTISSAPNAASAGQTISVAASVGVTKFSLIKMNGLTHNMNSDLHYINVPFTSPASGQYTLTLHGNANVLTPGYWMLFALNSANVPSLAKVVQIISSGRPQITQPADQAGVVAQAASLQISASDPTGETLAYSATGLPTGMSINSATGLISGTPTVAATFEVTVTVRDTSNETATTSFDWTIRSPGAVAGLQYDYYQGTWSALPNFAALTPIKTGTVTNFSLAPRNRNNNFAFRFKGKLSVAQAGTYTFFTTSDDGSQLFLNNTLVVNNDGVHGALERSGTINLAAGEHDIVVTYFEQSSAEVLTVSYQGPGLTKRAIPATKLSYTILPVTVSPPGNQTTAVNTAVSLQIQATGGSGALRYGATGLPTGLSINTTTGLISGTPTVVGTSNVTVTATDANNVSSSVSFTWTIQPPSLVLHPLTVSPKQSNTSITFTATVTNAVNPRFKWLWGDGTPETAYSTSATITKSYAAPGMYVAKVTATDDRGVEVSRMFTQIIHLPLTANRPNVSMNIAYETRASGNARVWVVNQDNDSVSVFDAVTNAKLAEIAVGSRPRAVAVAPSGRIWVVNKGAATLSLIDPATLAVAQTVTLPYGSQPFGLVFSPTGNAAYIALEAAGRLNKLDVVTGAITGTANVGLHVRHLSISGDGTRLLATRFITPKLAGEQSGTVNTASGGGEVLSLNTATMAIATTIRLQHSNEPDTESGGRGIPNYLGPAVWSPDGVHAWTPSKQDNVARGVLRDGNQLTFDSAVRSIASRINLTTNAEDAAGRIDFNNGGIASTGLFDRFGATLFVALEGSRQVAVVDAHGQRERFRLNVGFAPQGLALSPDNARLYVSNFMSRTVSVFNVSQVVNEGAVTAALVTTWNAVATERLTAQVLSGKRLFYDAADPRLARDAYISCAACHNDGGHDGRVWDFTGFGEGLRNTIALNGRAGLGQGFQHWSANFDETQDFEGQIRNFAGGTGLMTDAQFNTGTRAQPLGDRKSGVSTDLDALAAYVASLNAFERSPSRTNGALTSDAVAGRDVFRNANCAQCHSGTAFTESGAATLRNIGTIKPSSGSRLGGALTGLDTPTLRDVWATAPYLHDGSAATLADAVTAHQGVSLSATNLTQLVAYLQQIGSEETTAPANNQAPTVTLTAPANNATFTAPAAITLTATAADADGTIARVEFYNGATKLGEDTASPYSFAWTNVAAGSYSLTARALDNAGAATFSTAANVTVSATAFTGTGLYGEYFDNDDFTSLKLTRVDATIDFDWQRGSPHSLIGPELFSVRWTGQVQPIYGETYTFYTQSDDGVRLWVNNQLLIDNWIDHALTEDSATITLQANQKYNIRVEYFEGGSDAVIRLLWSSARQAKQIIPQIHLYPAQP
jgi:YVTN family beta-propeller protein